MRWLAASVIVVVCFLALGERFVAARGFRHGPAKGSTGQAPRPDANEEQYEASLADVCDQRDSERAKARAVGKLSFYSEECLPLEVSRRRQKRLGEKKHFATCEAGRDELRAQAVKVAQGKSKARLRLVEDCFNLVPDIAAEVEMSDPADPIYANPPAGAWKDTRFYSCGKARVCTPIARAQKN